MEMEMQVVELRIHLHCRACEKAVRKAMCRIKGVKCVEIDATLKKMTVLGYVDRKVVIKALWKTGRRAEAWLLSASEHNPLPPPPPPPPKSGFIRCINLPTWGLRMRSSSSSSPFLNNKHKHTQADAHATPINSLVP